jgi:hypothetical protein
VNYSVADNSCGIARNGALTIAGQTQTVNQAGISAPTVSINGVFMFDKQTLEIDVTGQFSLCATSQKQLSVSTTIESVPLTSLFPLSSSDFGTQAKSLFIDLGANSKPSNHRRALSDWPTPDGLKGMLEIDAEAAQADLKVRPFDFGFPLRPYQKHAIDRHALPASRRQALPTARRSSTAT